MSDNDDGFFEGIFIEMGGFVLFVVVMIIIGFLIYLLIQVPFLFSILDSKIESKLLVGLIGSIAALTFGTALYFLRKKRRMLFALTEIVSGMATAWLAVGRVKTEGDLSVWLSLGAAAALVIAGIENIQVAKREQESD